MSLSPPAALGTFGFYLGSDASGGHLAQGQFEELATFASGTAENIALDYQRTAPLAALGPLTPEEYAAWKENAIKSKSNSSESPSTRPAGRDALLSIMDSCASELLIERGSNIITVTITNATAGARFDVFRSFDLIGNSITNGYWHYVTNGTNGQRFTFPNTCPHVCYVLGCTNDSDADGLTDVFEVLVSKTSPLTNHSVNAIYTDLEMVNVLVNDPEQDCGTEQNTQFETTCAVLGTNVIVAYVDSNLGVYRLGQDSRLTNHTPRLVGYSVSRNSGAAFNDMGNPPLSTRNAGASDDGDAGDPVLAVDTTSQIVYLVGTSSRNLGSNGIPFWESTDGGATFTNPVVIGGDILQSDKPWLAVDNAPGTGQHDVYVTFTGKTNTSGSKALWMVVSTNGSGGGWTNPAVNIREPVGFALANSPILQVGSDHIAYAFWLERTGNGTNWTNSIMTRQVQNRGTTLGSVHLVRQLVTSDPINGTLKLQRSNTADTNDFFNAWPFPVPAVNPATNKAGHLYVAYADKGENTGDKADVFFVYSTDGGTTWSNRTRVNTVWTNDQWMPVLAVKPEGTNLFIGWYDRRSDRNNSLIDFYGRWASIASDGTVSLGDEFRISTVSFPPVFAGILANDTTPGNYDPVYPPVNVNLHWWYPEWPDDPAEQTDDTYVSHVGEYNGVSADGQYLSVTWTDSRLPLGPLSPRKQTDLRTLRLAWP